MSKYERSKRPESRESSHLSAMVNGIWNFWDSLVIHNEILKNKGKFMTAERYAHNWYCQWSVN